MIHAQHGDARKNEPTSGMFAISINKEYQSVGGRRKGPELGYLNMFKMDVSVKTRSSILKSSCPCVRPYQPLSSLLMDQWSTL